MFYLDLQITNMGKQANRTTGCLRTMVSFSDFVRLPLLRVIMQINAPFISNRPINEAKQFDFLLSYLKIKLFIFTELDKFIVPCANNKSVRDNIIRSIADIKNIPKPTDDLTLEDARKGVCKYVTLPSSFH